MVQIQKDGKSLAHDIGLFGVVSEGEPEQSGKFIRKRIFEGTKIIQNFRLNLANSLDQGSERKHPRSVGISVYQK